MAELKDLVGEDLSAYRIKTFYEVQITHDEIGIHKTAKPECFLDEALAAFRAKGASWYGGDGNVVLIYALVNDADSEHGLALTGVNAAKSLTLCNEAQEKLDAAKQILAKLTPEERAILGHPDPE